MEDKAPQGRSVMRWNQPLGRFEVSVVGGPFEPLSRSDAETFTVGKSYIIRTISSCLVGIVKGETPHVVKLEMCSFLSSHGIIETILNTGALSGIRHVGEVYVSWDVITDAYPWNHPLPAPGEPRR